ncbi:MAG: undecaprenyl-diphosphate phosphatase [Sulfuricurvum sp.]|uniref:undecaprenyl-diphosphate phosphatase n=1 Tax=Sulfuricurvum sp. TaxID=2025608 RepID=UPI0026335AD1|nr:undecaprenyl-diphosphate phosphatase [Sulfuricurvum sp.]MDD2368813.1 undecaprenyl-diphosphate phosphatase [Sulfuricurvum sp.]MDD5117244.1 undecaprenyl-diphosphate phosphatase [Sulfuricurvum sp.]
MTIFDSLILGALEGVTEFLPISSTGHLILASQLLGLQQTAAHKAFEVSIQLGSILAVLFLYAQRLLQDKTLWFKIAVAFLPTGALGFLLYKHIKALFGVETVSIMLIAGGIIFLLVEYLRRDKAIEDGKDLSELTMKEAFVIGIFQSLSMVPGTSRSGATIIGGLFSGLNRKSAAEFSFLLAIPTMFIATAYDLFKHRSELVVDDWSMLIIAFVTAFIFAFATVKAFVGFVSRHTFVPFAIYRIIVGIIFFYMVTELPA